MEQFWILIYATAIQKTKDKSRKFNGDSLIYKTGNWDKNCAFHMPSNTVSTQDRRTSALSHGLHGTITRLYLQIQQNLSPRDFLYHTRKTPTTRGSLLMHLTWLHELASDFDENGIKWLPASAW